MNYSVDFWLESEMRPQNQQRNQAFSKRYEWETCSQVNVVYFKEHIFFPHLDSTTNVETAFR